MTSALSRHDGRPVAAKAKVLIVDDSVVARGLFARWLGESPLLDVVGSAADGATALRLAARLKPELIVLDIEMPIMDGLAALPEILKASPLSLVVVASSLTARSARLSLQCLSLGATDILPKPDSNRDLTMTLSFREELVRKLEDLISVARERARPTRHLATVSETRSGVAAIARGSTLVPPALHFETTPRLIVIGASTGGPRAITTVLEGLKDIYRSIPILVVQHMPPVFTASLAEQMQNRLSRPVREAIHGESAVPGTIYIAPGGQHLRLIRADGQLRIELDNSPAVKFSRPSVDVTFSDAARATGASTLGIVLTGMGNDGLEGARLLHRSGATLVAQDELSSVVWGMPGAICRAGLAHHVLPPDEIGTAIHAALSTGQRP